MEKMRDIVIFVGIGLLVGVAWWHFYVKPHDEFRSIVTECMILKDDMSLSSYDECVNENAVTAVMIEKQITSND